MEASPTPTVPDPRRWSALALLCGAFFMVILDAAIVTVPPPSIEKTLDFSAPARQGVVGAYALAFAGLLLLGGASRRAVQGHEDGIGDLLGLEAASLGPIVRRSPPIYIVGAGAMRFPLVARRAHGRHTPRRPIPRSMRSFAPGS